MKKHIYDTLKIARSKPAGAFLYFYRGRKNRKKTNDFFNTGIADPPRTITLYMTGVCNYQCPGCHVMYETRNKYNKTKYDLDLGDWKKFIDELAEFKPKFELSGGEPTLRDDVCDIVQYISDKGCLVSMITNGAYLTEELCNGLIDAGLDFITISLDGDGEYHNKSRGIKDAFEKTFKGIETLDRVLKNRKGKKLVVGINSVIDKFNFGDLENVKYILSLKKKFSMIRNIDFIPYNFFTENMLNMEEMEDEPKGFLLEDEYMKVFEENREKYIPELHKLIEEHSDYSRIITVNSVRKLLLWFSEFMPDLSKNSCHAPWDQVYINPDGMVSHCLGKYIGKLGEKPFMEIYNSKESVEFRQRLMKENYSLGCIRCCMVGFEE